MFLEQSPKEENLKINQKLFNEKFKEFFIGRYKKISDAII
jgi:hypothetical protein